MTQQRNDHGPGDKVFEVEGTRLRVIESGAGRLDALIELIDGARTTLRVLYYIFAEDESGQRVRDALDRAARRGVKVSLIVDGFGSSTANAEFFERLEADGAQVCRFLPRFGRRYLLRNHQKLVLADEAKVIVGGFNVEHGYFSDDPADGWRDLGLVVEGPAAGRLAPYYDALHDWVRAPDARMKDLRRIITRFSEAEGKLRWLMGGPTPRLSPWAQALRSDLRGAKRLDMIAGYFAPNPGALRRIEAIGKRGGSACMMTAAKSDNQATIMAARHTYASLLKRGVRVFEYTAMKLHTKLFVIDDATHIGSANFDVRSLFLNMEIMLRVDDPAFAAAMHAYAEGERGAAQEIGRRDHRRSTLLQRMRWGFAYFMVAVLDPNLTRRLNFGLDGQ